MGAYIEFYPISSKFKVNDVSAYLLNFEVCRKISGEAMGFSILQYYPEVGGELPAQVTLEDMRNEKHLAHKSPYISIEPDKIHVALNWCDTPDSIVRKFCEWILSSYECRGVDWDGFEYKDSKRCMHWVRLWLPDDNA